MFYVFLALFLFIAVPVTGLFCVKCKYGQLQRVALMLITFMSWICLAYYYFPPKNLYLSVFGVMAIIGIAFWLSQLALSRWLKYSKLRS